MDVAYDVAVIGAGIAGLTSAALLAHSGARVVLMEHHDKAGGCAGYFSIPSKWGNFSFPTGATAVVGLENGGLHQQIFQTLGVDCPTHPIDRLRVVLPDLSVDIHHEQAQWKRERQKLDGNRLGQEIFWQIQEAVADSGWRVLGNKPSLPLQKPIDIRRNLALIHPPLAPMLMALPFSVGELMKWLRIDRDRAFSALVNLQLLITVQSLSHAAPLSNGMAGLDLWRHGAFHPVGGVGTIAQILLEAFKQQGGETRFSTTATSMCQINGIWKIATTNGEVTARQVVANIPVWQLNRLIETTKRYPNERTAIGHTWGAVNLYIAIRDEVVPTSSPLHSQVLTKYHSTPPYVKPGLGDDVFLSLSLPEDELSAPKGYRTLNVSTHVNLREWQSLSREEYRHKKKFWREKLLTATRVALPDLDDGVRFVITATPSTWEDYTLRSQGSVGGSNSPARTPI